VREHDIDINDMSEPLVFFAGPWSWAVATALPGRQVNMQQAHADATQIENLSMHK
jgi:hypothetical protein